MSDETIAMVRKVPMFAELDDDEMTWVADLATDFQVPAGFVLIEHGQPGSGMFIVTEGTVTIHTLDAQPNTVQGEPPGWSIEASVVDKLGIVRIKRSDYSFDDVVPTFEDLPPQLQSEVVHRDAIAVNSGGVLSSITYEYGVGALGDDPVQRTRLTYDVAVDLSTANANLSRLLTSGWDKSEETDAVYFTSATSTEIWTLDDFGGTTHLIYDTGG